MLGCVSAGARTRETRAWRTILSKQWVSRINTHTHIDEINHVSDTIWGDAWKLRSMLPSPRASAI